MRFVTMIAVDMFFSRRQYQERFEITSSPLPTREAVIYADPDRL